MKLSDLVVRWKDKGLTKPEALDKAKAAVKKAGKRWTASQQLVFDTNWKLKKKQVVTTAPAQAKPAKVSVKLDPKKPEHKGILKWVKDYAVARKSNPKLAKQLKVNIDKAIKKEKLDEHEVYFYYGDPDAVKTVKVIKPLSKLKPEKVPRHPKFIMPRHPDEDDLEEIVGEIDLPEDLKKMTPFQHEQVVNWTMHRDKADFQRREKALKVLLNLAAKDKNKMLLANAKIVSDLFYKVKLTKGAKWKEVSSDLYEIPPKDSYVEL